MHFTPETPTYFEWLALIQQDAAQAKQLMIAIKARDKREGLMSDASLQNSVENYLRALKLLDIAGDPAIAKRIIYYTRLGRVLLGPYLELEDWIALIDNDPTFARDVWLAWKARQAMLGLSSPQGLLRCINLYYEAREQR
jgi:hypothetical protein